MRVCCFVVSLCTQEHHCAFLQSFGLPCRTDWDQIPRADDRLWGQIGSGLQPPPPRPSAHQHTHTQPFPPPSKRAVWVTLLEATSSTQSTRAGNSSCRLSGCRCPHRCVVPWRNADTGVKSRRAFLWGRWNNAPPWIPFITDCR